MNVDYPMRTETDDVVPTIPDAQEDQPPNLGDWQNDIASDDEIPMEHNENSFSINEEHVERMELRQRDLAPIPVLQKLNFSELSLAVC